MDRLRPLLNEHDNWLDADGPGSETVLSTRVRLARNLESVPFPARARDDDLETVLQRVAAALPKAGGLATAPLYRVPEMSSADRAFLVERHLASRDLVGDMRPRGIVISPDERLSMMINEEDHLRIQGILSGFQVEEAWDLVNRADDDLDALLDYAYGEQLGYLTACPTNVGTGLRVSVLVHLPALVLMKQVRRVLAGATQIGFAVRGFYGEGSDVVGNFFQISNQRTLGEDEREILDSLKRIAQQVLSHEAKSRDTLLAKVRLQIEDKVYRALGTLKYARSLAMQEVLGLASAVRFGVSLGFGGLPGLRALNAVVFTTQPAHLQLLAGRELDAEERKVFRAERVRAILGAGRGAGGTSDA